MVEYVDPFEYLEEVEEKVKNVIEDPFKMNFRPQRPDTVTFPTSEPLVREATVDLENSNISINYNVQNQNEEYIVVLAEEELGLVESHAQVRNGRKIIDSVHYHLVTPETVLRYDGNGYSETQNELPREVAEMAPELYEIAEDIKSRGETEKTRDEKSTVPPPEDEFV